MYGIVWLMATPLHNRPQTPGCSTLRTAPAGGEVVNRCCGKDLGPVEDHEAPSEEDIARFGDVTRTCPNCREEVYDDAEVCYHCGEAFAQADKPLPIWAIAAAGLVVLGMLIVLIR